ncbi:MAG: GNAT family protein [Phycisphaerae bacterium]
MTIRTPRLVLRDLVPSDAQALNEIERDERVTRYMPYAPHTADDTRRYIEEDLRRQSEQPRRVFEYAMVPHDAADLIGRCGLRIERPEHREAMLWYAVHPDHWRRGYAREAVSALLDRAFGELALHRVFADCDPRNTPSCRLAERMGMTLEGRLRENYFLKGEWCDSMIYGILDREWKAIRERDAKHVTERDAPASAAGNSPDSAFRR